MKLGLILVSVAGLMVLAPNEAVFAQEEPVITLLSPEGEPIAQVSDYSISDGRFCFAITNISTTLTILAIGTEFGKRDIRATGFSQIPPGDEFVLSPSGTFSDFGFDIEVGFVLVVNPCRDGIHPGMGTAFCVEGHFEGLKAKDIVKDFLVIAGTLSPVFFKKEDLRCTTGTGDSVATVRLRSDERKLCFSVKNDSRVEIVSLLVSLSGCDIEFSGFVIPPRKTSPVACVSLPVTDELKILVRAFFRDGSICSTSEFEAGGGGLTGVVAGRAQ